MRHEDYFDLQVCVRRLLVVSSTPLWSHAKNVVGPRWPDSDCIAALSLVASAAGNNIVILIPLAKGQMANCIFSFAIVMSTSYGCAPDYLGHLPAMSIKATLHATAPLLYLCRRYPKCLWGLYASPPPVAMVVVGWFLCPPPLFFWNKGFLPHTRLTPNKKIT